jgi:hypothetical protein
VEESVMADRPSIENDEAGRKGGKATAAEHS